MREQADHLALIVRTAVYFNVVHKAYRKYTRIFHIMDNIILWYLTLKLNKTY